MPRGLARTSVCATYCFAIRCDAASSSIASITDNGGRRGCKVPRQGLCASQTLDEFTSTNWRATECWWYHQSIRGTANDTLGNDSGSILLGLLCLSCGGSDLVSVARGVGGRPVGVAVISAAVNLLSGVGLLAAGLLALLGRSEYVAWKRRSKRR